MFTHYSVAKRNIDDDENVFPVQILDEHSVLDYTSTSCDGFIREGSG